MHHTTHILTTGIVFLLLALLIRYGLRLQTWVGRILSSFFMYSGVFLLLLAFLA